MTVVPKTSCSISLTTLMTTAPAALIMRFGDSAALNLAEVNTSCLSRSLVLTEQLTLLQLPI